MANVKICDRCGKKIDDTRMFPIYIENYRSILGMEDQDYRYTNDLCGTCTKKLLKFLNSDDANSETGSITEATDE